MEAIQTILFFALGATIIGMTIAVLMGKKIGVVFSITKYLLILLVAGIAFTYGNIWFALAVIAIGVGSDRLLLNKR